MPAVNVERLVMCGFECEAGPLHLSDDFKNIIEKADLWIVVKWCATQLNIKIGCVFASTRTTGYVF